MKVKKKVVKEVEVVDDIICNNCGKSLSGPEPGDFYGLVETMVRGGYSSDGLVDGEIYTFSLCETCLKKMFDAFKIPPG